MLDKLLEISIVMVVATLTVVMLALAWKLFETLWS